METHAADLELASMYAPIGRRRLDELNAGLAEVAAHDEAPDILSLDESSERWSVSGYASFTGLAIWEHVKVCFDRRYYCEADLWGPTMAIGGVSWGTAWFDVPESRLDGEVGIQCYIASVAIEVSFWWGARPIGVFAGGGIGIGGGMIGGKGNFVRRSC
jgi:hypothetical protein